MTSVYSIRFHFARYGLSVAQSPAGCFPLAGAWEVVSAARPSQCDVATASRGDSPFPPTRLGTECSLLLHPGSGRFQTFPMRDGSTCVETDSVLFRFRFATQASDISTRVLLRALLFSQCEVWNPCGKHENQSHHCTNYDLLKQCFFSHFASKTIFSSTFMDTQRSSCR